ncbi:hypothetical protein [Clostridium sp. BNL1100]|uniref:hypothetical protein n=1 Tax=Clostridium sp. BNL1100 TaxID=755731 RepID=UPI00024A786F|nr:hypothetical protein [Clostridium sp. BNL1100]AEY67847.1 hypothetical protein Clo1100_3728 [Clostridium sp. BNL1100]
MEWKENLSKEEFESAMVEAQNMAKEGLLSKEDFEKALQSESDKIRTKYVQEKKILEDELAKLRPKEKELEAKQQELLAKEAELKAKEKQYLIQDALTKNNLPAGLAKYLNSDDVEGMAKEVTEILNTHLLSGSFKPSTHQKNEGITKEQFQKMNYAQRMELFKTNPELYKKLA